MVDRRIAAIADHYGYDSQTRQLTEEMAELTAALNRFWRKRLKGGTVVFTSEEDYQEQAVNTPEMRELIGEIADVEVCLEQLRYMLDMDEEIDKARERKIRRQLERMAEEHTPRINVCILEEERNEEKEHAGGAEARSQGNKRTDRADERPEKGDGKAAGRTQAGEDTAERDGGPRVGTGRADRTPGGESGRHDQENREEPAEKAEALNGIHWDRVKGAIERNWSLTWQQIFKDIADSMDEGREE